MKKEINPELLKDPTFRLRYMGFCLSVKPSLDSEVPLLDLCDFAKYQLCAEYKIPMKSNIWDSYTDEELLMEYFALLFYNNPKLADEFEKKLTGEYEADIDWFDSMIEKNKEDIENLKRFPKEINFNPKDIKE